MRRRKAREFALQALFALDNQGDDMFNPLQAESHVSRFLENFAPKEAESICDTAFLRRLVKAVIVKKDDIDVELAIISDHWKLSRMTKIDLNILRIGQIELNDFQDVPPKVTIDECVELAKKYGSEESSAFVNGILDRVLEKTGRRDSGQVEK